MLAAIDDLLGLGVRIVVGIVRIEALTAADGDSEGGAPVGIIEMQAAGMPVLSTYHADIPEVVRDGESGYLVPERDVEALAEKLDKLINEPETWENINY